MAKKPTAAPAASEAIPEREGPSAEEQAMVDAEQRELMARNKVIRDAAEAEDRKRRQEQAEKSQAVIEERRAMSAVVAELLKRVEALERKG